VIALSILLLPPLLAAPVAPARERIDKMAELLSLEDRRSLGGSALEGYLRDADRGVRRRAALGAGRIGEAAAVPALLELLNDGEVEVRQMAAFALGLIGDRSALDRLVAALGDSEAVVRTRSLEALGRIGDPRVAPDVARAVEGALPKGAPRLTVRGDDPGSPSDPWTELRAGLFALFRLKDSRVAEAVLVAGGHSRFDWWAATYVAMRLESPLLKPVLADAAASSDPLSRAIAARGLGALKDSSVVDLLAQLTRDRDPGVALAAVRALGVCGDGRGTAPVAAALDSTDLTVKHEALRALAALPPDRSLRARVVPYVGAAQPWIRAAALEALAHTDKDEFALVLSGLDPDTEWSVRAAKATALGLSPADDVSASILHAMLKDEDVRVVPFVLEALRKSRGADAAETLRGHLSHPDPVVRASAAEGLAALALPGTTAPLLAAYRASPSGAEIDTRAAIVSALATQKGTDAIAALEEVARADPSRVVRGKAATALRERGREAPPLGPEAVDRPFADYREAMRPYDPIPGVPLYSPRAILHTRYGVVEILLDTVEAPLTVASFVALAERGFYDGLTFHRVVPGFVAQGGCPRGDGSGGPGYALRSELGQHPYGRGAVGIATSGKDTGGSQFFITLAPAPHLDGAYALFGSVTRGMDVVEKIRPGDLIERVEIWDGRQ
jgi:cyclophilin family peptidyl-prolyl cis-trans isomerase/HEAT repeat protein